MTLLKCCAALHMSARCQASFLNPQTTLARQLTCPTKPLCSLASNQASTCLETMHHVPGHGCNQCPSMQSTTQSDGYQSCHNLPGLLGIKMSGCIHNWVNHVLASGSCWPDLYVGCWYSIIQATTNSGLCTTGCLEWQCTLRLQGWSST